jgi:hypothetical protein
MPNLSGLLYRVNRLNFKAIYTEHVREIRHINLKQDMDKY